MTGTRIVTWAQSAGALHIYRGGQLVAVITGSGLVDIARVALAAHSEGTMA